MGLQPGQAVAMVSAAEDATRRHDTLVSVMAALRVVFALCVQTTCWDGAVGKFLASKLDRSALQIYLNDRTNTAKRVAAVSTL